MKRKLLSVLLTLCLAFSLLPTAALADGEGTQTNDVAQIGSTGYATLQAAIDAAKSGDTIVLKKSISATEIGEKKQLQFEKEAMNLTLDLNQNTITAEAGEAIAVNAANITLIVKNGTIKNFANGKYSDGVYAYKESNNLTLTFENIVLESRTQGLAVQGLTSNSNVNIVNSKITSTEELGIYYPPKSGTLTITDSEITGVTGIVVKGSNLVVVGDKTVISGTGPNVDPDTYYTGATDGSSSLTETGDALYIESGYNDRDITVAVKGGSFTSAKAQAVRMFIKNGETTTVKREVKVTGGTFSSDVSAYCEKNYYTEQNADNTYTVKSMKDVAVAKIGDTYYKSLVDAYAALPRGEGAAPVEPTTITLLKNSEGGGIGSDKTDNYMNYVIDFNGHTYTVGAPAVGSTGTVSQGIRVLKGSTAKFMNGTLKAANYEKLRQVVHTYGDVTFEDFTVDATGDPYAWAAVEPDAGSLKILGNSSILAREGQYGLYAAFWHVGSYDGTTVDVDTTGKITGKLAYEFDEDYTGEKKATENKGFVNIKNGNFDILSIQEIWSDVSDAVNKNVGGIIISGGYFTSDPTAYLAAGKGLVTSDQNAFAYKVGDKDTDVETAVTAGEAAVTIPAGVTGITEDSVKSAAKAANTTKTLTDTVAASGMTNDPAVVGTEEAAKAALSAKGISVNSSDTVTVVVQPYLEVNVKSADDGKLTLEISAKYNVVATTGNPATIEWDKTAPLKSGVPLSINKPIELTIVLPTDFAAGNRKIYVQHKGYEYTATVDASGATATFINPHGFSTFTVTPTASAVAEVDGTSYTDLQKAVDAVANNGTVKLLNDTSASAVVSRAVKFTLDKNSKSFTGAITAGSGYELSVDGNVYTFTVRSSSGSSGSSSYDPTYSVSTPSKTEHGTVTVSPKSASKGDRVTVTVKPDSGYVLETLTVTDKNGNELTLKDKGNGKYTFTMPAGKVEVKATFMEDNSMLNFFYDVPNNAYFYEAVKWAVKNGITTGVGNDLFAPEQPCTRAQIVTFLWRAAGSPEPKGAASGMTDVVSGSYYEKAVAWAIENGITTGTTTSTFSPDATCTRAQAVTFLARALKAKAASAAEFSDVPTGSYFADAVAWAAANGVTEGIGGGLFGSDNDCTRGQIVTFLYRAYNK